MHKLGEFIHQKNKLIFVIAFILHLILLRSLRELFKRSLSYVRREPRNGELAKMGSLQRSKRSDNKQRTVEVRCGIFCENLTYFSFP